MNTAVETIQRAGEVFRQAKAWLGKMWFGTADKREVPGSETATKDTREVQERGMGGPAGHASRTGTGRAKARTRRPAAAMRRFRPGERFVAPIKAIHAEGVYIRLPGGRGAGILPPQCWGEGAVREEALSMLHPGNRVAVVVKEFHPSSMTVRLELDGDGKITGGAAEAAAKSPGRAGKEAFRPIEPGATLLVDTANLLGLTGPEHAARKLGTLAGALRERGYEAAFFLEQRTLCWCAHNQGSEAEAEALRAFVQESCVTLVENEADLAMLQAARAAPGSVCCTRDRFADYSGAFPEIVGSARHRPFSLANVGGKELLCIDGLLEAIVLNPAPEKGPIAAEVGTEEAGGSATETAPEAAAEPAADDSVTAALVRRARAMLERGETERGTRYVDRMAKSRAEGYRAIAGIYAAGLRGSADEKTAKKYRRLAEREERRLRQCIRRGERLRAQWRKTGCPEGIRASRAQRAEMALEMRRRNEAGRGTRGRRAGRRVKGVPGIQRAVA